MPKPIDPLKAQAYRTQRAEMPEDLWQPLYDRMHYPATGASQISFFSVPKGQSTTLIRNGSASTFSKTSRDTNIDTANVIPTKMFKFVGISLGFCHLTAGAKTNPSDRDEIREGGWFEFKIVDKKILELPLICIPELNPFNVGSLAGSASEATILGQAGGGGLNAYMYKLAVPITLNPYENFSFIMYFDGPPAIQNAVDIYVILHGFMRRPT